MHKHSQRIYLDAISLPVYAYYFEDLTLIENQSLTGYIGDDERLKSSHIKKMLLPERYFPKASCLNSLGLTWFQNLSVDLGSDFISMSFLPGICFACLVPNAPDI